MDDFFNVKILLGFTTQDDMLGELRAFKTRAVNEGVIQNLNILFNQNQKATTARFKTPF